MACIPVRLDYLNSCELVIQNKSDQLSRLDHWEEAESINSTLAAKTSSGSVQAILSGDAMIRCDGKLPCHSILCWSTGTEYKVPNCGGLDIGT
jgi:hypothetical protein